MQKHTLSKRLEQVELIKLSAGNYRIGQNSPGCRQKLAHTSTLIYSLISLAEQPQVLKVTTRRIKKL